MSPCPRRRRSALLLAPALTLALLAGCGGSTPEQQAITDASAAMHGLGFTGSTALPAVEKRKAELQKVLATLKPAGESKNPGEAAAASGLVALAQAGLAEIAASGAADAESQALMGIAQIRAVFDQWQSQKAVSDSLKSYDPTAELAKIDDQIRQREAEAGRAAAAKQAQVALVDGIRLKAKQARDQVAGYREQEAAIRAAVANGSQTQRAAAFEQAMGVKRQGDEYEKQAAGFEAEAASQAPEIDTLQSTIDKLNKQVALLREAKKSMIARADANKAQAAAALAEADESSRQVTKLLTQLEEIRGRITQPTDDAVRLYGAAVAAAKKSGGSGPSGKGSASVTAGNIQQSLADVLATRARGLGAYAVLLKTLQKGGQPGVSADAVSQAEKAHADAVTAVEEAYKSAIQMFESAGGGGDMKEKIERVTTAMKRLVRGEEPPPAPPAEPAPGADAPSSGKPVEKPAEAAADFDKAAVESEIRAFIQQVKDLVAKDQFTALLDHSVFENDADRALASDLIDGLGAILALNKAAEAKFGKDIAGLAADSKSPAIKPMAPMLSKMMGKESFEKLRHMNLDTKTMRVEVKSATEGVVYDDPEKPDKPSRVRKVDGAWKMVSDSDERAQAQQVAPMMKKMVATSNDLRSQIEAGKFATSDDLLTAFAQALMKLMAPPGGGKPGAAPGGPGGGG